MAIVRQFVLLGEIDKVVDARFVKSGKLCARIRFVCAAERVLAGQQAAGNDPIAVGQRSIHSQSRRAVRGGHRRMLPAIDSTLSVPTELWIQISITHMHSGSRKQELGTG